jgi:ABC transport system ATP-binding/permease protein
MAELHSPDLLATFPLNGATISVGRDPSCDVSLAGVGVSRRHATIVLDPAGPVIADSGSTFGTRVDDHPVTSARLHNGAVVDVGIVRLVVALDARSLSFSRIGGIGATQASTPQPDHQSSPTTVNIGRDASNDIQCAHPLVSRFHASFVRRSGSRRLIIDHQSANGTFVNGRLVKHAEISDGDVVQIGPYRFFLQNGDLVRADDHGRVKVEVFDLSASRGSVRVLDDVSFTIMPGEFVAVLGPSGAGKTTLGHVLTGQVTPESGRVYLNGLPLNQFCRAFNSSIGFVSQHNVLHNELTVYETFHENSILRLPVDSLPMERRARIAEVLELLDLTPLRNRQIRRLSGGEAKRVHVGVELLSSPALIILDEPLAGLDSGLVRAFMALFRKICDEGHTVVLTTHALESVELCDSILFVNKGRIQYQGRPAEILRSLGLKSPADLYERSKRDSREGTAAVVRQGDTSRTTRGVPTSGGKAGELPLVRVRRPFVRSTLAQVSMLVVRYFRIFSRDVRNLIIVFAQVPLICALLACVFTWDATFLPIPFYFCIAISAIWVGGVNAVREIARERELVRREYRAGLSLVAYALSKLAVFGTLSLVQSLLFGVLLNVVYGRSCSGWQVLLLLTVATTGGMLVGLGISSLCATVTRAVSWLPIVFIPQIFFSGILVPFDRMPGAGEALSYATVSRPVFSLLKRSCVLELSLWSRQDWLSLAFLFTALIILVLCGLRWSVARRNDH